jgi:endonuclease YncB( thermonuclease family)
MTFFTTRIAVSLLLVAASVTTGHGEDAPLWTEQPTRIDRSRQHYERLPAAKVAQDSRLWLMVPSRIKVLDSASFVIGEQQYQIAHIRPVKPKRLCQAIEGGRWPCGRMASIFLGNLVRSKRLLCDISQVGSKLMLSKCVIGTRDIAAAIVTNGYGMAEADKALLAVQTNAQKARAKGLWRNPLCDTDFDNC